MRALHDGVLAGGGAQYVERHRARDKMMVRERLEALADPGTPVLELCPLAGLHTGDPVGGGVVVALAEISHTQCLVIANDPTVRGGTTSPTTERGQPIASSFSITCGNTASDDEVLNTISTLAMVQLGKVYENLMVDLRATNSKLQDRAERIIATVTGLPRERCAKLLNEADGHVKVAIVMHSRAASAVEARRLLADAQGILRDAMW